MLQTLITSKTRLTILVKFFIKTAKKVDLLSFVDERKEATKQPLYKSLKNSISQPTSLDTILEIVEMETKVKNILV